MSRAAADLSRAQPTQGGMITGIFEVPLYTVKKGGYLLDWKSRHTKNRNEGKTEVKHNNEKERVSKQLDRAKEKSQRNKHNFSFKL